MLPIANESAEEFVVRFWFWFVCALTGLADDVDHLQAAGSRRLAGALAADGSICVAWLTSADQIQLFRGQGTEWKSEVIVVPGGNLVPDAPLVLLRTAADQPQQVRALTVARDGRFMLVTATPDTSHPTQVTTTFTNENLPPFSLRAGFACVERESTVLIYAVDENGKLVELDLATSAMNVVEDRDDVVLAGGKVRTREANADELYLVDRRGNLVSYVRDPIRRWKGPLLIGMGFQAGSDLVVWRRPDGAQEDYVAAVNARGELRLMRHEAAGWRMDIAPGWLVPPGTPISVFHTPINIRLTGITAAGVLQEMHLQNTEWRQRRLGIGYQPLHSTFMPAQSLQSISVDAAGDLLVATHSEEIWSSFLTPSDNSATKGQVVSREWSPPEYQTQDFRLLNSSEDDLVIRLRDRRQPLVQRDLPLAKGQQLAVPLDCEIGRTLTSQLKPPVSPNSTTAGAEDQATETPVVRTTTTLIDGPFDIEVLKSARGLSYQDVRLHQYPRSRATDSAEISLGGFSVIGADAQSISLTPAESSVEIDVVKSATSRRLTSTTGPAVP